MQKPVLNADLALADGVYFDLPAETYHADPALGSGDLKRLARNPTSWWYWSKHNPLRPQRTVTPAMRFGLAVHCCIIEGRAKFEAEYGPCEFPGNVKAGKDERAALAEAGKVALPREDYDRAMIAAQFVLADPELKKAFQGGAGEVSVFWTNENGVRLKARFDYLKQKSIVDLKSTYENEDTLFDDNCKRLLVKRQMFGQMYHYHQGRDRMKALVEAGAVFGEHDQLWLAKTAAEESYSWVWIFYQSGGAPEVWGCYSDRNSKLFDMGASMVSLALSNYTDFKNQFGLDGLPWVRSRPLERFCEDDVPEWAWR